MLSQYNGKDVYACQFFGTRLNLNTSTFSLCHEVQVGDQILGPIGELSVRRYEDALSDLIGRNFSEDAPCRRCDKCRKIVLHERQISYVTISLSSLCNSRCIYCQSHMLKDVEGYDPIPFLEEFDRENKFSADCYFDWGGGEPTLSPFFEPTVSWITKHHYYQRINTNAIIFSEVTEQALKEGIANLRISIDSGSKDCFARMKGHEKYEDVWNNIARYRKAGNEIYLKYNICNYNSDLEEIDLFLDNCRGAGVENILIDAEISAYQPQKNAGPFYFTEKEHEAAHYMEEQARQQGFMIEISPYAYSVRGEYDDSGRLKLPSKYFDNINREVISNGIFAETFPSVEYMAKEIRNKQIENVVVWGAGCWGKEIVAQLKRHGIRLSCVIDENPDLWGKTVVDVPIVSPENLFCQKKECIIILTSRFAEEMLKKINEVNYKAAVVYWLRSI